ncbi:MAG: 3D domain-containing protein [Crocinitomicaceae bacterium]|nr:3D domain-containing protein [Crocinitomicaceae bacterium]
MKSLSLIALTWTLVASQICEAQDSLFNYTPPVSLDSLDELNLWATEYYVHRTTSQGTIPYLTDEGDTLGYFSDTCDFCTACLEGTVFIEDSILARVVLNYSSRSSEALVNCRTCDLYKNSTLRVESWGTVRWKLSSGFGEGVKNYALVPYRTIAVDPSVIPYGSVIFIPAAIGVEIPRNDGSSFTHDGYFFAGDTGGAIKKNHIDVFTGVDDSHPFEFVKSSHKYTYPTYLITDEEIIEQLTQLHLR